MSKQAEELDGMKYAIIRSRDHEVLAGYVESFEGRTVHLRKARRIWYFKGVQTLEEFASCGSKLIEDCKITTAVESCVMLEARGIIYCSEKTRVQIQGAKEWKQ